MLTPRILATSALFALAGCGGNGPGALAIVGATDIVFTPERTRPAHENAPYVLVNVNRDLADTFAQKIKHMSVQNFHAEGQPQSIVIGTGDVLDVAIVSTSEDGFIDFTNASVAPISQTELAPQPVGVDGRIRVPPLGRVRVAGRSVAQVESLLERELSKVLVTPSAIVSIADRRSAKVSIVGEVPAPGQYSISETNLRLLDMLSLAGGPLGNSKTLQVRLSRKGDTRQISLLDVYAEPKLNIFVRPGDLVEVEAPETDITVLGGGAVGEGLITLTKPQNTLIDVLGSSAGLLGGRNADRTGVFLLRHANHDMLNSLGVDTKAFGAHQVPTVFRFDMTEPDALFMAKAFPVQDGDIVYVTTSLREQLQALAALGNAAESANQAINPAFTFNN